MKKIVNVTSEFTIGDLRAHRRLCRTVAGVSSFLMLATCSAPAFAAGTSVLGGDAVLTGAARAALNTSSATDTYAQFVANAGAKSAVLDWSKFNIGAGKEMNFSGEGTTFFNLVSGASKSQIDGIISGNGSVWVINPNGIAFGANSQVNVGGLFAAAAGNLSNADQLRDGTATLPQFDSFAGTVSAASGSKFTADQVALLGKTVSAASSDFSGAENLAIGAASSLVVDEVAGGKVTVNLETFVEKTADELELGSLNVDGEVRAVTDGALKVNGGVDAGSVYLKSGNDQNVAADMHAKSGNMQLLTQDGDLTIVDGVRVTASGDGTTLQIQTAQNDPTSGSSEGSIRVDGSVIHEGVGSQTIIYGGYNGNGDVTVAGKVQSAGEVRVLTDNGGISIEEGASVSTSGEGEYLRVYSGVGSGSAGGDVRIVGSVSASGNDAVVDIESGYNYYTDGGLEVSGSVTANGENGSIVLAQGNGYGSTPGKMLLSGKIKADGTVSATSYDSTVEIASGAAIVAKGDVTLIGVGVSSVTQPAEGSSASIESDGQVTIRNVTASAESLDVRAKGSVFGIGSLNALQSNLSIRSEQGDIFFSSSYGAKIFAGRISLVAPNGNITANNKNNVINGIREITVGDGFTANVKASNITNLKGNLSESAEGYLTGTILIDGDLSAPEKIALVARGGDVYVMKGCTVSVTGKDATVVFSASAEITLAGKIAANQVTLSSGSDLHLTDTSVMTAADKGGVKIVSLGDLTAAGAISGGTVDMQSSGDLILEKGADVLATGKELFDDGLGGTFAQSVNLCSMGGKVTVGKGSLIKATDANAGLYISSYANGENAEKGGVVVDGEVVARTATGDGEGMAQVDSTCGNILVNGCLDAGGEAAVVSYDGDVTVNGRVSGDITALVESQSGNVTVNGIVSSADAAFASSKQGDLTVGLGGLVTGANSAMVSAEDGDVVVKGRVESVTDKSGTVLLQTKGAGDIVFSGSGSAEGGKYGIVITENGDVNAENGVASVVRNGYADLTDATAVLKASEILIDVKGSVAGSDNYLPVVGKVYGKASGSAHVAAVNETSIVGGEDPGVIGRDGKIVWSSSNDIGTTFEVRGNLGLYTTQEIEANGAFVAGGDLTLSAGSFGDGDVSYLQAGGVLSLNNVGKPAHPQIAYFESVNGVEPTINNQPNDTVIFVDGRLAGGNLKILNQFGANEAFMVSTPELKSTQGIFGNPTFLHSDLDVANPMEVSAIDYMLQETPRLTLGKEFPSEVDSHVDSVVVPEKDSIQFGRGATGEEKADADGSVAMVK